MKILKLLLWLVIIIIALIFFIKIFLPLILKILSGIGGAAKNIIT